MLVATQFVWRRDLWWSLAPSDLCTKESLFSSDNECRNITFLYKVFNYTSDSLN